MLIACWSRKSISPYLVSDDTPRIMWLAWRFMRMFFTNGPLQYVKWPVVNDQFNSDRNGHFKPSKAARGNQDRIHSGIAPYRVISGLKCRISIGGELLDTPQTLSRLQTAGCLWLPNQTIVFSTRINYTSISVQWTIPPTWIERTFTTSLKRRSSHPSLIVNLV